jgi:hypothetical protein
LLTHPVRRLRPPIIFGGLSVLLFWALQADNARASDRAVFMASLETVCSNLANFPDREALPR